MNRLEALLADGPTLFDGAMGTELLARGADAKQSLEGLNLTHPALVRSIHLDYLAAGASVITTNTFGGNRFRLGEHYLEDRVADVNTAGARLALEARNAAGRSATVLASVGPLGKSIEPIGSIKRASAQRIYEEQITALAEAGVDAILLETFTVPSELELAVAVANQVAPDLPVIASMSFDVLTDEGAQELVAMQERHHIVALGVNCGSGPEGVIENVAQLREAGAGLVMARPNAGLPERVRGRLVYTASPDYFEMAAERMVEAGATLIGGCCGTGPAHVAAMREALRRARTTRQPSATPIPSRQPRHGEPEVSPSRLAGDLAAGRFVLSVEMRPPRGIDPKRIIDSALLLREAGCDYVDVTDAAMARMRMGVVSCAALLQQQAGLEPLMHFITRDRNVMAIQSELLGAHALGIRNVLCMKGDPTGIGDYPGATAVWDVSATGLITILANLNRGLDANGTSIGTAAQFFIGAAVNPTAENMAREIRLLRRKVEAGADFLVSNAFYDVAALERLREAMPELKLPIIAGVMPLASARHAAYLRHEVPGVQIPDWLGRRIEDAGDGAARVGIDIALEMLEKLQGLAQGAYVIPAAGRYDLAAELLLQGAHIVAAG